MRSNVSNLGTRKIAHFLRNVFSNSSGATDRSFAVLLSLATSFSAACPWKWKMLRVVRTSKW